CTTSCTYIRATWDIFVEKITRILVTGDVIRLARFDQFVHIEDARRSPWIILDHIIKTIGPPIEAPARRYIGCSRTFFLVTTGSYHLVERIALISTAAPES